MPREGDPAAGGESVDELRQQARVLMAKPEYTSKSHQGHAAVATEVQNLYDRIERIEKMGQRK